MSANLTPAVPDPRSNAVAPLGAYPPAVHHGGDERQTEHQGAELERLLSAINRYKWLVLAVLVVGSAGGVMATRFLEPKYQVASTILLTGDQSRGASVASGPIRVEQSFDPQGWIDLLRSFAIADSVVMKLALYVKPSRAEDANLFRDFTINRQARTWVPGKYTLEVKGPRYTLRDAIGIVNESGIVGDSVGRSAGFGWRPSRTALGADRTVKFTVQTPRETSVETLRRMSISLARGSNIIILQLTGQAQEKPAETLNAWGEQFVRIATDLKSGRLSQFSKILDAQRNEAADRLTEAERKLQLFRVDAITKPSEGAPIQAGAVGIEMRDPMLDHYFTQKLQADNVKRDRELLERIAPSVTPTSTPVEGLFAVQTIVNDQIAAPLRTSLKEYMDREAQLRLLRQVYTDSNPTIKPRIAELQTLQAQIPVQLKEIINQLTQREAVLRQDIGQSERDLQGIPTRTITEEALRREVMNASQLYMALQQRFAEAELSERSTIPDVRVLDAAVMPLSPTANTTPRILALAVALSLGVGLGLAILLDRADRRFRYPSQATKDLGLEILGVVPVVDTTRRQSPEKLAQVVEAFRSIRLNLRYACAPSNRVVLTITSPGPNEGKSLVASNLALSFAEGGWRTILIDGDLRRGQLNTTFDLPATPGLADYLEGTSLLSEVVYPAAHENLSVLPSGTRHRRGPELLATPRMHELIALLARDFDAVIVDTPPLGAGTDAYALATATTNVAVVVRGAMTDLRMAQAKLRVLDNLPVRVLGTILNGIDTAGAYQYYSYDPEYLMVEETTAAPQLTGATRE